MSNIPVWLQTAHTLIGTREVPGSANSPVIMNWARIVGNKIMGIVYAGDHVPWCGLTTAYCMTVNGIRPPNIAVRASAWATWGIPLREGVPGAILVFTREGGGHVGFYVSEDATHFHVLGGNQSDAVNIQRIAKTRCSAIRWPAGVPIMGTKIIREFLGPTSVNEA